MMNKKGQEGFTMVQLMIALVVLVLVVIAVYWVFTRGQQVFGTITPASLDTLVMGCNSAGSTNGYFAFCEDPKEITDTKGQKQYVNCNYGLLAGKLQSSLQCNADAEKKMCEALKTQGKDMTKTRVNEKDCSTLLAPAAAP